MICKNCSHRVIRLSPEEAKDFGFKYAHGSSKTCFVVYPMGKCHKNSCGCKNPSPKGKSDVSLPNKEE